MSENLPAVRNGDDGEPKTGELFEEIMNPKKRALLCAVAQCSGILLACQLAGVHWQSHYHWVTPGDKYFDPIYKTAFERAKKMSLEARENEIIRRGFHGFDKAIVYKGRVTGYTKEFSDLLALASMNADWPEKYHRKADDGQRDSVTTIQIVNYQGGAIGGGQQVGPKPVEQQEQLGGVKVSIDKS